MGIVWVIALLIFLFFSTIRKCRYQADRFTIVLYISVYLAMISKLSLTNLSIGRIIYFLDFSFSNTGYNQFVYFLVQAFPVLMIQIAFINILISWFYLGYSLRGWSLNEQHIWKTEVISTWLLIILCFLVISFLLLSIFLKEMMQASVDFYSVFNVIVFFIIFVIYIAGGIWMLRLMKWILVTQRY